MKLKIRVTKEERISRAINALNAYYPNVTIVWHLGDSHHQVPIAEFINAVMRAIK